MPKARLRLRKRLRQRINNIFVAGYEIPLCKVGYFARRDFYLLESRAGKVIFSAGKPASLCEALFVAEKHINEKKCWRWELNPQVREDIGF